MRVSVFATTLRRLRLQLMTPNPAFELTIPSALRVLEVTSQPRSSAPDGGERLASEHLDQYEHDETAFDVVRPTAARRRSRALDRVLPEDRIHVRRAMGRLLRDRCPGRTGTSLEGSAQEPRRA